jgi:WD40 repeat protein
MRFSASLVVLVLPPALAMAQPVADVARIGGKIWTGNKAQSETDAMAVWGGAQDASDTELQRLADRARTDKSEALRQDVLAFLRTHYGSQAAVKAGGLLRDLPSPLDKLDPRSIPELERFPWHPKETIAVLGEHRGRQAGSVTCALFSRNGKWLASGSSNGLIRVWDPATMRLKHSLGHGHGVYCMAISKDNGLLAIGGGDGQVRIWDMTVDPPKQKDKGLLKVSSTPLFGIALAPNGKTLACGGSDARVYLWDLAADPPKELNGASGHGGVIQAVAYSPGGKLIASGGADKTLRLWTHTEQNRVIEKHKHETPASVLCLAFHPTEDRTLVTGGADGVIRIWDVGAKLTQKHEVKFKHGAVNAVAFSASGKTLAAAFGDGTAHTWGFGAKFVDKAMLEGHKGSATSIAFAPDGTFIATGGVDWTVRLWPGASGIKPRDKTIARGHLSHVYSAAFRPDATGLATGSYDHTVRLWDFAGSEAKEHIAKLKEENAIYTVAYSPDGKLLAAGGASTIFRTCEADTGRFLFGFIGHAGHVSRLAWSPDGKRIASCGTDKTVRIWDGPAGKGLSAITTFETPVHCVTFAPDGKRLACSSGAYLYDKLGQVVVKDGDPIYNDSTVRVYDANDFQERGRLKYDKTMMTTLVYTPDGRSLLAGGVHPPMRKWDAMTLPIDADVFYKGGTGGFGQLTCSADGRWLACYSSYRVELIDLATGKVARGWPLGEQFAALAFAPDSRHLAVAVNTGVVLILRVEPAN